MTIHVTTTGKVIGVASSLAVSAAAVAATEVDHSVAIALINQLPAIIGAVGTILAVVFSYRASQKGTGNMELLKHLGTKTDGLLTKAELAAGRGGFLAGTQSEQERAARVAEDTPTAVEVAKAIVAELKKQNGD